MKIEHKIVKVETRSGDRDSIVVDMNMQGERGWRFAGVLEDLIAERTATARARFWKVLVFTREVET